MPIIQKFRLLIAFLVAVFAAYGGYHIGNSLNDSHWKRSEQYKVILDHDAAFEKSWAMLEKASKGHQLTFTERMIASSYEADALSWRKAVVQARLEYLDQNRPRFLWLEIVLPGIIAVFAFILCFWLIGKLKKDE